MTDIPTSLAGVTADWLTARLADAGHDLPAISALDLQPMDGFVGAMGEVGVIHIDWASAGDDLPSSFVVKCPLDDDIARLYNDVMQYYVRESGFYRDLVDKVDMTIPKCWINLYDDASGAAFLMLEHITGTEQGDILDGCSVVRMRALVTDLARMHGKFWMDPALVEVPWLIDWNAPSFPMGIPFIQDGWARFMEAEPDRVPADVADVIKRAWIDDTVTWLDRLAKRPWTLTHIDYELDNVLFSGDDPVILDWQSVMRSFPGMDLGWCLAASHNEQTLAAEPELLDLYRAELAAAGGPEWTAEQLEEDMAIGMLHFTGGQPIPYLQDTTAFGDNGARMHARFDRFLQGCIDACVRWNVVHHVGRHLD